MLSIELPFVHIFRLLSIPSLPNLVWHLYNKDDKAQ